MRFRAAHLVCVMLLLSSLGATEAHGFARGDYARHAHAVSILRHPGLAGTPAFATLQEAAEAPQPALPGAPVAHTRPAWSVQPPVVHTAEQHACTGSGL